MILYHGSFLEIEKPDLVHSRPNVDFGRGFYVTPLYEQAEKWCGKFKRRGKDGIISCYKYDESQEVELKILKFDSYSEEWLDFILDIPHNFKSIFAPIHYRNQTFSCQFIIIYNQYLHFFIPSFSVSDPVNLILFRSSS